MWVSFLELSEMWGVPPWERSRVPLLFIEDKLIAVVGYFLDRNYAAKDGELGVEVALVQ